METIAKTRSNENRKELMAFAQQHNLIITPPAMQLLTTAPLADATQSLQELIRQNVFIVNALDVETKLLRTKITPETKNVNITKTGFVPKAKEYASNYRERTDLNFSARTPSTAAITDFVKLFADKFEFLASVLRKRSGFSPKPIAQVVSHATVGEIDFCGMVQEKWVSKNGHLAFRMEDLENECIALVLKSNEQLMTQGAQIMPDEVIGIKGKKGSGGLVIINEILQPDLPLSVPKKIAQPLSVAIISDLHVGSKLFLEKELTNFFDWLKGKKGTPKERETAGHIKYLFVTGDNVDGIGVYPNQIKNLLLKDIFEQYQAFEDVMLQVPEYIEVFVIPGQHDAVRWADPQPAIPKQYVPRLQDLKNFHFLPSPGWVEIEGLTTLLYHGAALHEMYHFIPALSMAHPERAMIEVLKRRSFLMNYGDKQPYAPEKQDYLRVSEKPDFYFGGDMHHIGFDTYRGCSVVNASCFQARTEYEIKLGHIPTPGIVPVIELDSRNILSQSFAQKPEAGP